MLGGTRGREGRRREERTAVRKHRKGHGPCKPVNEMALDSRTGKEEEILDQRVTNGVASGQDHPPLHQLERISLVRNRMREICASGSVGGEGATPSPTRRYNGRHADVVVTAALDAKRTQVCMASQKPNDAGPRPRRSVLGPPASGRLAASVRQLRRADHDRRAR